LISIARHWYAAPSFAAAGIALIHPHLPLLYLQFYNAARTMMMPSAAGVPMGQGRKQDCRRSVSQGFKQDSWNLPSFWLCLLLLLLRKGFR